MPDEVVGGVDEGQDEAAVGAVAAAVRAADLGVPAPAAAGNRARGGHFFACNKQRKKDIKGRKH